MLDDGGNGRVGHGLVGREAVGHNVLVRDAHLGTARADERVRAVLGRLDDLDVQALVGEVALGLGHVDAGVVGVGGVVKHTKEIVARSLEELKLDEPLDEEASDEPDWADWPQPASASAAEAATEATEERAARDAASKRRHESHYRLFPSALFQGMHTRCSRSTSFMRPSDSAEMTMMTANMRSYEKDLRTRVM